MTDTITAAAVCPLGKLGSPGNSPLPTEVIGRGRTTSHFMPVTYTIGATETTTFLATVFQFPVIRMSIIARRLTNAMQPTVENRYAHIAEKSRRYSGPADRACRMVVSPDVTATESRNSIPTNGIRQQIRTVAAIMSRLRNLVCMIMNGNRTGTSHPVWKTNIINSHTTPYLRALAMYQGVWKTPTTPTSNPTV